MVPADPPAPGENAGGSARPSPAAAGPRPAGDPAAGRAGGVRGLCRPGSLSSNLWLRGGAGAANLEEEEDGGTLFFFLVPSASFPPHVLPANVSFLLSRPAAAETSL